MSHIKPQLITAIAESIGISQLHSDAASVLAPDVEYRVRDILQEATKFTWHSKRTRLSVADINHALQLLDVEVLYGFSKGDTKRYARTTGATDVFYLEEVLHRCEDIIYERLPKAPVEVGVVPHWFLINGVKPNIPENRPYPAASRPRLDAIWHANPTAELPALAPPEPTAAAADGGTAAARDAAVGLGAVGRDGEVAQLVPVAKHIVSVEQQEYMRIVTQVLLHTAPETEALERALEHPVFASLAADEGLEQLLPYLVALLAAEVPAALASLPRLRLLLRAAHALVLNRSNNLESYLHQLLPCVMTCLVAKRLGAPRGDHWSVRRSAAACLRDLVARFDDPMYSLQPRVCKQLAAALLDARRSLPTHYGALHGLSAMGPQVLQLLLLPVAVPYYNMLLPLLAQTGKLVKRVEAMHCLWALQTAVCCCCRDLVAVSTSGSLDPVALRKLHAMSARPLAARREAEAKATSRSRSLAAMDARIKELHQQAARESATRSGVAGAEQRGPAAPQQASAPPPTAGAQHPQQPGVQAPASTPPSQAPGAAAAPPRPQTPNTAPAGEAARPAAAAHPGQSGPAGAALGGAPGSATPEQSQLPASFRPTAAPAAAAFSVPPPPVPSVQAAQAPSAATVSQPGLSPPVQQHASAPGASSTAQPPHGQLAAAGDANGGMQQNRAPLQHAMLASSSQPQPATAQAAAPPGASNRESTAVIDLTEPDGGATRPTHQSAPPASGTNGVHSSTHDGRAGAPSSNGRGPAAGAQPATNHARFQDAETAATKGAASGPAVARSSLTPWELDAKSVEVLERGLRDASEITPHLAGAYDMFGEALLTWLPYGPLAHVFI